jgi:hypothetical protein
MFKPCSGLRGFTYGRLGLGRFPCRSCVTDTSCSRFPRKNGCPTWIRTKTKASKGPCATITPSDIRQTKTNVSKPVCKLKSTPVTRSTKRQRLKTRSAPGVIFLAAGASSRLGRPKMLLPWAVLSLLGRILSSSLRAWSKELRRFHDHRRNFPIGRLHEQLRACFVGAAPNVAQGNHRLAHR